MGKQTAKADTATKANTAATADPAAAAAGGQTTEDVNDLRFELLRSSFYHDMEQARLIRWSRLLQFLTILFGSSAAAGFAVEIPLWGQILSGGAAVAAALSLVCGFSERAAIHGDLRRRFYTLLAKLERNGFAEDLVREINAEMTMIFADEPPVRNKVNELAHDRAGLSVFGEGNFDPASRSG